MQTSQPLYPLQILKSSPKNGKDPVTIESQFAAKTRQISIDKICQIFCYPTLSMKAAHI